MKHAVISLFAAGILAFGAATASAQSGENVLLVVNSTSAASAQIADHYARARGIAPIRRASRIAYGEAQPAFSELANYGLKQTWASLALDPRCLALLRWPDDGRLGIWGWERDAERVVSSERAVALGVVAGELAPEARRGAVR